MYLQDKDISLVPNNRVCPKCGKSHYIDESTSYCLSVYRIPIYKDGKLINDGGETIKTDYKFVCLECGTVFDEKGNVLKEAPEKVEDSLKITGNDKVVAGQTLILDNSGTFKSSENNKIKVENIPSLYCNIDKTGPIYIQINNKEYRINTAKLETFIEKYLVDSEGE